MCKSETLLVSQNKLLGETLTDTLKIASLQQPISKFRRKWHVETTIALPCFICAYIELEYTALTNSSQAHKKRTAHNASHFQNFIRLALILTSTQLALQTSTHLH